MSVTKTKLAELPPPERAECEEILAAAIAARPMATARFVSDEGDTMAWYLLAFVAALAGLVGIVVDQATASVQGFSLANLSLFGLVHDPRLAGLLVAITVLLFVVITFLRVHKRHGWMATTFGVVRIRGQSVRLLRYAEVAQAVRRRVNVRRGFSVLELVATDGTKMTLYATALMDLIQSRLPPTAVKTRQ